MDPVLGPTERLRDELLICCSAKALSLQLGNRDYQHMTNIRPDSRLHLTQRNDTSRTSEAPPVVADPGEYVSAADEAAVSEGWPLSQPARAKNERAARMDTNHSGAEHHTLAAEHHEQAARQHRQASQHYEEKDYAGAARGSLIAHDHTQQAVHHSSEAGKYHAERTARHAKEGSK